MTSTFPLALRNDLLEKWHDQGSGIILPVIDEIDASADDPLPLIVLEMVCCRIIIEAVKSLQAKTWGTFNFYTGLISSLNNPILDALSVDIIPNHAHSI